jgi:flagellar biosynthesis/type III secretory pathway protein FliH
MTTMIAALTIIAQKELDLQTLNTRNSDSLDFKEQAVWQVKEALEQAYQKGLEEGYKTAMKHKGV